MEKTVPFSIQLSLKERVAAQGGGQLIMVTESVVRKSPQVALTVAEIRYFPALLKTCLGLTSAEILVLPLPMSPKFQAMALMPKSDFNRKPVPFARQVSVKRILPTQGLGQGTIVFVRVRVKIPQVEEMVAFMV